MQEVTVDLNYLLSIAVIPKNSMQSAILILVLSCKEFKGVVAIERPTSAKLPGRKYSYSCIEEWKPKNELLPKSTHPIK